MYNDNWLVDQGLRRRPAYGDLRDLVARRFEEGAVVSVTPTDTLQTVFQRMRYAEVSRLPVIDGGHIVGLVDESDQPLAKEVCMSEQHDKNASRLGFGTRVIHAGQSPDPSTGAIMPPIYANSTYVQERPGVHKGLDYGRSHNPTRWALERCLADLESGGAAFAFASGLAAIATVLELLDSGAHVIAGDDLYGGTYTKLGHKRL